MTATNLFAAYATDEKAEIEGIKTQLPRAGDTMFTIARAGNKAYNKLLQQLVKRNRAILDTKGAASEAKNEEIFIELFAKTILLGWDGTLVVDATGKPVPYSYEAAKLALKLKAFRDDVSRVSEEMENFKLVKEVEDEKN